MIAVVSVLYLCVNTKFDLSPETGHLTLKLELNSLAQTLSNLIYGVDVSYKVSQWSEVLAKSSDRSSCGDQVVPVIVKISNFTDVLLQPNQFTSNTFLAYTGGCEMFLYMRSNAQNCEHIMVGVKFNTTYLCVTSQLSYSTN